MCPEHRKSTAMVHRQRCLLEGLRKHGYEVVFIPPESGALKRAFIPEAAFMVCSGWKQSSAPLRKACASQGIPTLVVELGYLKRANNNGELDGFFQLGWNGLCWVPEQAPDAARLESLHLEIVEHKPAGTHILVGSQVGMDAQHNLPLRQLEHWLTKEVMPIQRQTGLPVLWRPHPSCAQGRIHTGIQCKIQNPRAVPLQRALDQAEILVTYNSTLGVDAMLRGLRVHSHPTAHYHRHAVSSYEVRKAYLERLAYAQWNLQELADGTALDFMLACKPVK